MFSVLKLLGLGWWGGGGVVVITFGAVVIFGIITFLLFTVVAFI